MENREHEKGAEGTHTAQKVNPAHIAKFLKDMEFPATKTEILECAKENGADQNVMNALNRIDDREYENAAEITKEVGKME